MSADDEALYAAAVPDPEHVLGGVKDEVEPDHPSVLGHMGAWGGAAGGPAGASGAAHQTAPESGKAESSRRALACLSRAAIARPSRVSKPG
jgi:hypothetical protein